MSLTEEQDKDLFDAVSAAIDEETVTPPNTEDENNDDSGNTDETVDDGNEPDVSDDGDEGADAPGDSEDETSGESSDKDEGTEPDEDSEAGDGDESEEGDDEDGDDAEAGDESAKDPDPINDPIPENTHERTRTRIESLVNNVKELAPKAEQLDEFMESIASTGASPDQYAATLGFLRAYNSNDTATRAKALEFARNVVKELTVDLGEADPSVISLDKHDDLKAEVEAGTLTEARALELATSREQKALHESRDQTAKANSDAQAETARLVKQGSLDLNQFEASKAGDPVFAALRPTFVSTLRVSLKNVHPTQWGQVAKDTYEALAAGYVPQGAPPNTGDNNRRKPPKNSPERAKQGAGGGGDNKQGEAGSALDAVNSALEGL